MISIKVPEYVRRFILARHGNDPYDLRIDRHNVLRVAFLSVGLHARLMSSTHANSSVKVLIEGSTELENCYCQYNEKFDRGVYMFAEFWNALYTEVELTKYLATVYPLQRVNYSSAIQLFLDRHNIDEDTYSYDNAWRQFSRIKKRMNLYHQQPSMLLQQVG